MIKHLGVILLLAGLLAASPANAQRDPRGYAPESLSQHEFYLDQVNRSRWSFSQVRA